MKSDIHPTYYPAAKVKCACGNHWVTGSTKPELDIAICSACHPFYTGQEKIMDTRGRVEKFKRRLEKTAQKAADSVANRRSQTAKPKAPKVRTKKVRAKKN